MCIIVIIYSHSDALWHQNKIGQIMMMMVINLNFEKLILSEKILLFIFALKKCSEN